MSVFPLRNKFEIYIIPIFSLLQKKKPPLGREVLRLFSAGGDDLLARFLELACATLQSPLVHAASFSTAPLDWPASRQALGQIPSIGVFVEEEWLLFVIRSHV